MNDSRYTRLVNGLDELWQAGPNHDLYPDIIAGCELDQVEQLADELGSDDPYRVALLRIAGELRRINHVVTCTSLTDFGLSELWRWKSHLQRLDQRRAS